MIFPKLSRQQFLSFFQVEVYTFECSTILIMIGTLRSFRSPFPLFHAEKVEWRLTKAAFKLGGVDGPWMDAQDQPPK